MSSPMGQTHRFAAAGLLFVFVATLLACAALFGADANNANAADTGSITGTLTDGEDKPVWSACVDAYDSTGTAVESAYSNSSGKYVLGSLGTGDYRIEFSSCSENVIGEFYDNKETLAEATEVAVTDGVETPDINAQLATGGSISGMVSYSADGPLDDVCIDAWDSNGARAGYARTRDDGSYTVGGLETGDYRLEFSACSTIGPNLAPEFYDDKTTLADAMPVAVTRGEETPDIDAELDVGGSISGVATGVGVFAPYYCLVSITAYDSDGNRAGTDTVGFSSGDYRIEQLATGEYRLEFVRGCANPSTNPMTGLPPVTRYYSGKRTLAEATPVAVTAGSETTGINESAEPEAFDSAISGTVKDVLGVPQSKLCVQAFDSTGEIFRSVLTNPFGDYRIAQLQEGDYRVKVSNCLNLKEYTVTPEFFSDKETLGDATVIEVAANSTNPGVNFEVETGGTDTTAPDTKIYTGPEGTIAQDQATFDFYSTDAHDTTRIQCRIDSEPYEDCVTPVTFSSLGSGPHTAEFRAEDVAGNVDQTPAARTFDVELTEYWATVSQVGVVGPSKVKKGNKARYSVTITNAGNTSATGVEIGVKGKGVSSRVKVQPISSGASRTIRLNLSPKKRGKVNLVFNVTSDNAGTRKVTRRITVR